MKGKTVIFEGEVYNVTGDAIAQVFGLVGDTFTLMLKINKVETTIHSPNFMSIYVPIGACYFLPSNLKEAGSDWSEGIRNA